MLSNSITSSQAYKILSPSSGSANITKEDNTNGGGDSDQLVQSYRDLLNSLFKLVSIMNSGVA